MSVYPPRVYYSIQTPKDYDEDALKIVAANASSIDEVANRLGVSPEAVAGSMAREITRADGEDPYSAIGHSLAVWRDLKFISERDFDRDSKDDLEKLHENPGKFDGDIGLKQRILHPTLSDIGPGAIKILTAIQIIQQFFSPGPKGGQVGPWVLFGNNYSNLNAILAKGGSLGLSVAPVPQQKPAPKASSKYMKYAEAGSALAPVRQALDALPEERNVTVQARANTAKAPATKYIIHTGGLTHALAPNANSKFLSALNWGSNKYADFTTGRRTRMSPKLHRANHYLKLVRFKSSIHEHNMLPSIAPVAGRPAAMSTRQFIAHHSQAVSPGYPQPSKAEQPVTEKINTQSLRVALNDLLNGQARLPPSGPTAFDPRLTPAWAGLKLPQ